MKKKISPAISGDINLGDIARDPQTGFEGQVFAICYFLNGCERLTLQPPGLLPDGQPIKAMTFDGPALDLIEKKHILRNGESLIDVPGLRPTESSGGGPRPEPDRGIDPGMEFQPK